jgi:hypothetical protein
MSSSPGAAKFTWDFLWNFLVIWPDWGSLNFFSVKKNLQLLSRENTSWMDTSGPLIQFLYVWFLNNKWAFVMRQDDTEFAFHWSVASWEPAVDVFSFLSPVAKLTWHIIEHCCLGAFNIPGIEERENCVPASRIASKLNVRWQFSIVVTDMIRHKWEKSYWLWCW